MALPLVLPAVFANGADVEPATFTLELFRQLVLPVLLPVVGVSFTRSLWGWATARPPRPYRGRRVVWGLVVVIVTFWVLRNVPAYPFTLLAPHKLRADGNMTEE